MKLVMHSSSSSRNSSGGRRRTSSSEDSADKSDMSSEVLPEEVPVPEAPATQNEKNDSNGDKQAPG